MTRDQKDKLQSVVEGWAQNIWFAAAARLMTMVGIPICLSLLCWMVTEIVHIDTREQLGEQQAMNDRKWTEDHDIAMQKRVDIVSDHLTDLKHELEQAFARKTEVELGFHERDQRLNDLERRVDTWTGAGRSTR